MSPLIHVFHRRPWGAGAVRGVHSSEWMVAPELKGHRQMSVPHRRETARGYQASPEQPTVEKWGNLSHVSPTRASEILGRKTSLSLYLRLGGLHPGRRFTYGYWLETLLGQFPQLPVLSKMKVSQVPGHLAYFSSESGITVCYFSFLHHFLQSVNTKTAFLPSPLWRVKARTVILKPTTETLQLGWSYSEALTGAVTAVPQPQVPSCL